MLRTAILLCVPIFVSGCTTEYFIRKFMDGPKFCPSDEMNNVVQNRRSIKHLSNRLRRDYVLLNMPTKPDKTEYIITEDNQNFVADYYQTTASYICGGQGVFGEHQPVFYQNGVLVGSGEAYYRNKIEPKILDIRVSYYDEEI